jgi:hypothetical protein
VLRQLAHTDVLLIDDWAMAPLNDAERARNLPGFCDMSEMPGKSWTRPN